VSWCRPLSVVLAKARTHYQKERFVARIVNRSPGQLGLWLWFLDLRSASLRLSKDDN